LAKSGTGQNSGVDQAVVNRVLLIAFHFPPLHSSSGIQRTLNFAKYLQEYGWQPAVLTAVPSVYETTDDGQLKEVPEDVEVIRASVLDTARDLAICGRYLSWMALPDRWISWFPAGVYAGLKWIRKQRPQVIWSTSPIATAHLIGWLLHRLTGIPWIADLRDSMTEANYPPNCTRRRVLRWVERRIVRNASRVVFTTPGALKMYAERYPEQPASRWTVIQNGYDENNFVAAEAGMERKVKFSNPLTLVHSGLLYLSERDPRPFFDAVAALHAKGIVDSSNLQVVLRATGHDEYYGPMLEERGIADIVQLVPGIPYLSALREMLEADGLLLFQAANCNHQIPAKLYEYLRAQRPILALTDSAGDTAGVLRDVGLDSSIVALDNAQAIANSLEFFLESIHSGTAPVVTSELISNYSRRSGVSKLAELLNVVSSANFSGCNLKH